MPNQRPSLNRLVVALAYEGLCAFEFGITAEIFGLDRPELGAEWYKFTVCAEHPGLVQTNAGFGVNVSAGLEVLEHASTIVIPGWNTSGNTPSEKLSTALLAAYHRGARIVTICSGAFLPAALGMLNGQRATTHWRYAQRLQVLYPAVLVDPNVLYVDNGRLLTSAGSAAGIDMLLHVVRQDFGAEIANQVARRMVVAAHRNGGQTQFIEKPVNARPDNHLARALDTIRANLTQPWSVKSLAQLAMVSERTLARQFRASTGSSFGLWLISQRVAAAKDLLETTILPMEQIASAVGLGSADNLRLHFSKYVGIPPSGYRKQFTRRDAP
ncbi:AraC family transcriptional regulator [Neokomagataea thailandica NBRC 106555]|uniref:Transcriptional regulator FtrA n=2 Tax=Neokomagataea TaxID=1223423 RepID=A0A4Y6V901_9PROT|nr:MULTISPECIES: transcriptional regulator FtrA [Neokomagataea]QDH24957.1 transcriptional regulator FtrA [Neokomagataea tanensis]GBR51633.1 AraC family transcriptional regulator [Neokomagataea thailandica NBRC 106555]